jgi:hypothetical protein
MSERPASFRECTDWLIVPDPVQYRWQLLTESWSECSAICNDGSGSIATLGVATRTVNCVRVNDSSLATTFPNGTTPCDLDATIAASKPVTVSPCNRSPCPSSVFYWSVGPWPSLTLISSLPLLPADVPTGVIGQPGVGYRSRAVACKDGNGLTVPDSACALVGRKPATSEVADMRIVASSYCASDSDCMNAASPNLKCGPLSSSCECKPGWFGTYCDSRSVSTAPSCVDGVSDVTGACCGGPIDIDSGMCCGNATSVVDRSGRCCTSGRVDACGVCDGDGVAVDVTGRCCNVPLGPSGVCCSAGAVDDCGTCSGVNFCDVTVIVPDATPDMNITAQLVANALGIREESEADVAVDWKSESEVEVLRSGSPSVSRRRLLPPVNATVHVGHCLWCLLTRLC